MRSTFCLSFIQVPVADALRCVQVVRANSRRWGLSGRVCVVGFSTGAHMAATAAGGGWGEVAAMVANGDAISGIRYENGRCVLILPDFADEMLKP